MKVQETENQTTTNSDEQRAFLEGANRVIQDDSLDTIRQLGSLLQSINRENYPSLQNVFSKIDSFIQLERSDSERETAKAECLEAIRDLLD